jgi:hypothetical protein
VPLCLVDTQAEFTADALESQAAKSTYAKEGCDEDNWKSDVTAAMLSLIAVSALLRALYSLRLDRARRARRLGVP